MFWASFTLQMKFKMCMNFLAVVKLLKLVTQQLLGHQIVNRRDNLNRHKNASPSSLLLSLLPLFLLFPFPPLLFAPKPLSLFHLILDCLRDKRAGPLCLRPKGWTTFQICKWTSWRWGYCCRCPRSSSSNLSHWLSRQIGHLDTMSGCSTFARGSNYLVPDRKYRNVFDKDAQVSSEDRLCPMENLYIQYYISNSAN